MMGLSSALARAWKNTPTTKLWETRSLLGFTPSDSMDLSWFSWDTALRSDRAFFEWEFEVGGRAAYDLAFGDGRFDG